jgi:hypothetical protein
LKVKPRVASELEKFSHAFIVDRVDARPETRLNQVNEITDIFSLGFARYDNDLDARVQLDEVVVEEACRCTDKGIVVANHFVVV